MQPLDLFPLQSFVDALELNGLFFLYHETIYSNYDSLLPIHLLLILVGGILNFLLHIAPFDGFQHAAQCVDLFQIFGGVFFNLIGQSFEKVRAGQGIDSLRNTGLVTQDLLSA